MAIRSCSRIACASLLGISLAGCADLLDIPNQPRLIDEGVTSALEHDAGPSTVISETPDVASGAAGTSGQGGSDVSEGETRTTPTLQGQQPAATGTTTSADDIDAGTPAPSRTDPVDAGVAPQCDPSGSLGPNGRCFTSLPALVTWSLAQQSCRALGAGWDLASIRSAEVNQFAAALLPDQAWLDGSDAAVEGTWRWLDDNFEFSITDRAGTRALNGAYVNWNPGEPNGGGNSDCLRIVPALAATWADLQCDMLLGALCEGPGP